MGDNRPTDQRSALERLTSDCFIDLPQQVGSVALDGLGGFDQSKVINFSDGLNIVYGPSGSGKTRLLKWIDREQKGRPQFLPEIPNPCGSKSFGEDLLTICDLILFMRLDDSCILIEDILNLFDKENAARFLTMAATDSRQTILTVQNHSIAWIQKILHKIPVNYVDILEYHSNKNEKSRQ